MPISPITAYLATSPGGLDSVAVIALASGGDMNIIATVQALRLLIVLFFGPILVRKMSNLLMSSSI